MYLGLMVIIVENIKKSNEKHFFIDNRIYLYIIFIYSINAQRKEAA